MHISQNFFSADYIWLIEIGFVGFILMLVNIALRFLLPKIPMASVYKEKLLPIFSGPFRMLLWTVGIFFAADVTATHFNYPGLIQMLRPVRSAVVILTLMWLVLRWKKHLLQAFSQRHKDLHSGMDVGMFRVLDRILTLIVLLISSMILLEVFGLSMAPLIAFGGVGAAAVGFAAKDVISNFFGGMMLYVTRPIAVGDYIVVPGQVDGHVEDIGWYLTTIRDKEKRSVYLPNAIFANVSLINTSRRTHRLIVQQFVIYLEDLNKVDAVTKKVTHYLNHDQEIDVHLPIHVFAEKLKDGYLEIHLSAYSLQIKETDFLQHQQEVLLAFHHILEKEGGQMAQSASVISFATPLHIEK